MMTMMMMMMMMLHMQKNNLKCTHAVHLAALKIAPGTAKTREADGVPRFLSLSRLHYVTTVTVYQMTDLPGAAAPVSVLTGISIGHTESRWVDIELMIIPILSVSFRIVSVTNGGHFSINLYFFSVYCFKFEVQLHIKR